ncbi:MAG: beta-ketoacyl-[acyl-carrier-protein] synthase family protein, partial [Planctomycetota bacterium]
LVRALGPRPRIKPAPRTERMTAAGELEQEPYATVTHVAHRFGAEGPALNCMTACAAGAQSVGEAAEIIRDGDADVMLAGGSHSMIHPLGMTGFIRLTAMSTRRDDPATASRPFDVSREGFVMGEGAGVVVLEDLEHALARGANILAEVAGYGSTADAYRITDIHPDGAGGAAAMRKALEQAGIDPGATGDDGRPLIHYINAHGTGTQENDKTESAAVRSVFGERAPGIPFGSIKSMVGHLIQAAGAVELIACVQAIRTGFLPPTKNLENPDPACGGLDHIPGEARDLRDAGGVRACLTNSFGFGGQNDCVCVTGFAAAGCGVCRAGWGPCGGRVGPELKLAGRPRPGFCCGTEAGVVIASMTGACRLHSNLVWVGHCWARGCWRSGGWPRSRGCAGRGRRRRGRSIAIGWSS